MHFAFDAASAVIATPILPRRPAGIFRCPEGFVSCDRSKVVRLPWFSVLARWDDGSGATIRNGIMTLARVIGAVCGDAAYLLFGWDLIEQFRQHEGVANTTAGELDGTDLQRLLIDPEVDLSPDPPFGTAVLAGIPLPFALDLDAGAVDQQMQRALGAAIGGVHGRSSGDETMC